MGPYRLGVDDLRIYLARRRDEASKVGLRLADGTAFLGWVVEVGASHVVLAWAPSPFYAQSTGTEEMSAPDTSVPLDGLDSTSLARYDEAAGCWVDFPG
jgi:hypothetical protein